MVARLLLAHQAWAHQEDIRRPAKSSSQPPTLTFGGRTSSLVITPEKCFPAPLASFAGLVGCRAFVSRSRVMQHAGDSPPGNNSIINPLHPTTQQQPATTNNNQRQPNNNPTTTKGSNIRMARSTQSSSVVWHLNTMKLAGGPSDQLINRAGGQEKISHNATWLLGPWQERELGGGSRPRWSSSSR